MAETASLLAWSLHLCAAGVMLQSLELLPHAAELAPGRLFGWTSGTDQGWRSAVSQRVYGSGGSVFLLAARAGIGAACVLLPWDSPATFWCAGALFLLQLYYNRRFFISVGNCDMLFLVEFFALAAAALPGASARLQSGALWFVAAQAALAYLVAGLHKLGSRHWRSGARLRQVSRRSSYDLPAWGKRSLGSLRIARLASWGVIGLELLLPLAPLLPTPLFWVLLGGGFLFHTVIAVLMGLHGFWWSFGASYPAFIFVHAWIHRPGA